MSVRITQSMLSERFLADYQAALRRIARAEEQLATGRKVVRPSDDPVIALRALRTESLLRDIAQFRRNADYARSFLDAQERSLAEGEDLLKRVRELLVQGSNTALSREARDAVASELRAVREQFAAVANTNLGGRYVFSGEATTEPAYGPAGLLDTPPAQRPLVAVLSPGVSLPLGVTAVELFRPLPGGEDLFRFLERAEDVVRTGGDVNAVLGDFEGFENNWLRRHTYVGSLQNRLELMAARLDDQAVSGERLLSETADTDLAEAVTRLTTAQNVYQAALGVGARILLPSLADFLR
ncbi:MAG: Flagellar hook-associated protein FlgL [Brockia lithotrophica]|uniref:Flagellar hook-associated protein FlgL n=1 Tax=Brockia lithotrophica TaxID=933949 RepID=A0A2T5G494_9BACL|nr:flagellar hook-associated protein FlgL [Brockia lithotrophica]PTQ50982.1 MAG: Flagellar hook-associated protein FlgL [Brockia lithotrophica]